VPASIPAGHLILKDTVRGRTVPDVQAAKQEEIKRVLPNIKLAIDGTDILNGQLRAVLDPGRMAETLNQISKEQEMKLEKLKQETVNRLSEPFDSTGFLGDTVYSDADRTVSKTFRNNTDRQIAVYLKVQYRSPVTNISDEIVGAGRLPFGASLVNLSPTNRSFTLNCKWFNGRKFKLTPGRPYASGLRVDLESKSDFHRLSIDVEWPGARETN
jgi:hypothetical protein